ncbi:phage terminase small subunit [Clostridium sp. KNHs205]|uniref:phage terminase small subunit n=1 Tax=Clostridium sp. KNHs205 TaxID=1449050 RepID=UPI00051AF76C|nr:phage terminase small subunit [Clostridium sp. KNHs205]
MARAPDERYDKAYELFKNGMKLVEIANQLNLPEGTVRRWKSTHKWDSERSDTKSERSDRKKGGQPGNKNATGPPENKNAEKHGFFSKYLPEETFSIIQEIQQKDPLDILWENIQIAYAAIVRAQRIAYVKDEKDNTIIKSGFKAGKIIGEDYLVQTAIDKQSKFMQAQARAQSELRSLIKQYDEMLHNNWDRATEEQKLRIEKLKVDVNKSTGKGNEDELNKLDEMLAEIKKQAGGTS